MMNLRIAVDFDHESNKEVFHPVRVSQSEIERIVTQYVQKMDYAQRRQWIQGIVTDQPPD